MEKQAIIDAIGKFIRQRPGLEFVNYGDLSCYRAELRRIARDKQNAERLLTFVAIRDTITAEMLIQAAQSAYAGRLSIVERNGKVGIDYCAGQYFPTEYRKAAAAVLASAIWDWTREFCMPEPVLDDTGDRTYNGKSGGDWLRSHFRREFGRVIQSRWFD
jgi:hypothetical protein